MKKRAEKGSSRREYMQNLNEKKQKKKQLA
jgi:hypothetical protein